jgi:hypothetical protein
MWALCTRKLNLLKGKPLNMLPLLQRENRFSNENGMLMMTARSSDLFLTAWRHNWATTLWQENEGWCKFILSIPRVYLVLVLPTDSHGAHNKMWWKIYINLKLRKTAFDAIVTKYWTLSNSLLCIIRRINTLRSATNAEKLRAAAAGHYIGLSAERIL